MSKFCPDCGWPYLEDTEYMRHLLRGICEIYQADPYLTKPQPDGGGKDGGG